jgi:nucleotide-binding universal stress UspA family protein
MLQGILIGLDGSRYSDVAVELGIEWATRYDARLIGLGIVDEPTITAPTPVPMGAAHFKSERDANLVADAHRRVEAFLKQFASRCAQAGVDGSTIEADGLPHEQIVLEAQRNDLVLMGKESYFHFETQEGPCETLSQVVHLSPRPVVVASPAPTDGDSVVVAYDGSLQAAKAVQALQTTGLDRLGPVHVVSVADHDDAKKQAQRAVDFLALHRIAAKLHVLDADDPVADRLLAEVRRLNARLLVMGAYGQPGIREFVLGSVTRSVLKQAAVPLLLAH